MSAVLKLEEDDSIGPGFAPARDALDRYGDALLRRIAAQTGRQRVQFDAEETRAYLLAAIHNPVLVDRTLKQLSPGARRLLRLTGIGGQSRWRIPSLVEFGSILGTNDGIAPVQELLESGLAFPELPARSPKVNSWETWLAGGTAEALIVHIVPLASTRSQREPLELPKVDFDVLPESPIEADGLEWLLRAAVAWQIVRESPLRLTQQGGLFKRDLDRLSTHPVLASPPVEQIGDVPDAALLTVMLAQAAGLLVRDRDQIVAADFPESWSGGVGSALAGFWAAIVGVDSWDPTSGLCGSPGRSISASAVLAMAVLAELPADQWAKVEEVDRALAVGPDGRPGIVQALLLGILHQLRLIQATKHKNEWWVRCSAIGVAVAQGKTPPTSPPALEQTLLVQPNLEIILYRQGLTPGLVARLSRIAEWKSIGIACTLGLTADSVYRGLESGESLTEILALFDRHGTRPLSETVLNSLRSWASKRERILAFPSALVLEFREPADLERAVRLGLVEHRVTDRIGLIGNESRIDYQQLRLSGTRDYLSHDELCVEVSSDGLTLTVNEHKSDLLLESELQRFAERTDLSRFQLTVASLHAARKAGLDENALDAWFRRRTGLPLPPAALLLISADRSTAMSLIRTPLLRVPTEEQADGLAAWPETAGLVGERLAPTVFAVSEESIEPLRAALAQLDVDCRFSPN
jgi:hypothetical protein